MPKLRRLSGPGVIRVFERFGFLVFSQKGSHVKLKRITESGEQQTLTIPNHNQLDAGTCKAISVRPRAIFPRMSYASIFTSKGPVGRRRALCSIGFSDVLLSIRLYIYQNCLSSSHHFEIPSLCRKDLGKRRTTVPDGHS